MVFCSVGEVLEGIHITMPYSIASYMVRDFLREGSTTGTVDEELVGTLTGILVSSTICSWKRTRCKSDLFWLGGVKRKRSRQQNSQAVSCAGQHILPQPIPDVLLLGPFLR